MSKKELEKVIVQTSTQDQITNIIKNIGQLEDRLVEIDTVKKENQTQFQTLRKAVNNVLQSSNKDKVNIPVAEDQTIGVKRVKKYINRPPTTGIVYKAIANVISEDASESVKRTILEKRQQQRIEMIKEAYKEWREQEDESDDEDSCITIYHVGKRRKKRKDAGIPKGKRTNVKKKEKDVKAKAEPVSRRRKFNNLKKNFASITK